MTCRRLLLVICGLVPILAPAQSIDNATRELIQTLLTRIDTLEKRVAELEHGSAVVPPPAPDRTAVAPNHVAPDHVAPDHVAPDRVAPDRVAAAAHDHDQVVLEGTQPSYPSLKMTGFSDFNFSGTDLRAPAAGYSQQTLLRPQSGFQEGQFILHFSSALSPRVNFFGELSFTARPDAGQGSPAAPGFNAEVERAIIRFDQSDMLKLSFGRYHTPINYWNTAFHHGQWLQTTISRPEMTQFGGSFIPVHFIGALAEGTLPAGGLNLNYNVGVGNGRGAVISRGGDFGDINNNRAWLANAFIRPNSLYALQVGGSVYRDEVNSLTAPAAREWIQSGHIVWHKENSEFIAEFANVSHRPIGSSATSHSQAWYLQTAFRLPGQGAAWKPYYRFEYTHVPNSDTLFRAVPTFHASTAGVRYDLTSFAALKFEFRRYNRRNLPDITGAFSQVSFTF